MQKVDRLGWAAGFSFRAFGLLIGVRTNEPAAIDELRSRAPFASTPSEETEVEYLYSIVVGGEGKRRGSRRYNLIYSDATQICRTLDWQALLDGFERDVELFVAERARGRVFVHAGVVEKDGVAIVLPGRTLGGKSTLVAELVRAGATYFSDEFAILDEEGLVYPFPRPLQLRRTPERPAEKYSPPDVVAKPDSSPVPVACVLLTEYKSGARFRPRRLSPGRACLELLQHTLSARTQPELVLPALATVTSRSRVYETARGEARALARTILALVEKGDGIGAVPSHETAPVGSPAR